MSSRRQLQLKIKQYLSYLTWLLAIFDTALVLWGRWGFRGLGVDNMFVLADAAVFQRYSPTSKAPPCLGPSPCLGIKRQKSIRGMRSSLFWPCRGFPCQRFFFARGLHVCQYPCHKTYCLGSLFDYFKNSSCLGSLAWSSIVWSGLCKRLIGTLVWNLGKKVKSIF